MKSLIATICILGLIGLAGGIIVKASDTASITCNVTPASVSVSVLPATPIDYGTMLINATLASSLATATNNGGVTEDFDILGADAATGTSYVWLLSSTTPATDIYMHCYTTGALSTGAATDTDANRATAWVGLDIGANYQILNDAGVAADGTQTFLLDMRTPSTAGASTTYNEIYETTVTIRATQH